MFLTEIALRHNKQKAKEKDSQAKLQFRVSNSMPANQQEQNNLEKGEGFEQA